MGNGKTRREITQSVKKLVEKKRARKGLPSIVSQKTLRGIFANIKSFVKL